MRIPRPLPTAETGTRGRRPGTPPWRCAARRGAAGRGSSLPHHVAESLAGEPETQYYECSGQRQQQEAECGALFPIEAGDELGIDLLGEPLRVLAAEQRGRQVIAQGEHEHHDAYRGNTGRSV